jgi:uncharacterized protein YacL
MIRWLEADGRRDSINRGGAMSSTRPRTSESEDWRLKVLTDAIGNALGTGLAGAVALVYGVATGIIQGEQRKIIVNIAVFVVAIFWSLFLWSFSSQLEKKFRSRRLANLVGWGGGHLLGFAVLAIILYTTDNQVIAAFWAMVFGYLTVLFLNLLEIMHRPRKSG